MIFIKLLFYHKYFQDFAVTHYTTYSCMHTSSGIATSFNALGGREQWQQFTEITNIKKNYFFNFLLLVNTEI